MRLNNLSYALRIAVISSLAWGNFLAHADDAAQYYESALSSYADGDENAAFIEVKNALQADKTHLPSKILISRLFFEAGNMAAAEEELEETLALGADINLVLPILGRALLVQKKTESVFRLEAMEESFSDDSRYEYMLLKGQAHLIEGDVSQAKALFDRAYSMRPTSVRSINTLATFYLQAKDYSEALRLAGSSLELDGRNEKTWVLLGDIKRSQGNLTEAWKDYQEAYQIDSDDPKLLRSMAVTALKLGEIEQVRKLLEEIDENSPDDPTATLFKAWLALADSNREEGMAQLGELSSRLSVLDSVSDEDLTARSQFVRGTTEYMLGHYLKAEVHFVEHLRNNPQDTSALRMLADIYLKQREPMKAIELLENRKEALTKDPGLTAQLIQLYILNNRLFKAEQLLPKMPEQFQQSTPGVLLNARMMAARGKHAEALSALEAVNTSSPLPMAFNLFRGQLEVQLNQLDKAADTAMTLAEVSTPHIDALNFAAAVFMKRGMVEEASAAFSKILAIDSDNVEARYNLAILKNAGGDVPFAFALLNEILEEHPSHLPSYIMLARIEKKRGNIDLALARLNKAISIDRDSKQARLEKLKLLLESGRDEEALTVAQQLLSFDRLNPDSINSVATILIRLERYSDAKRYLNMLFSLWSKDAEKLTYLSTLQRQAEDIASAEKSLNKAVTLKPNLLEPNLALVDLRLQQNDLIAASTLLKKLNAEHGPSSELSTLKGAAAIKSEEPVNARKYFTEALEQNPYNDRALIALYQLSIEGVGQREFTALLAKLIKEPEQPIWKTRLLADAYLTQGNAKSARQVYESLLAIPGLEDDPEILNNLANILSDVDLDLALETARKGLAKGRQNPALNDTIGWILARQGKFSEALKFLRDAYSMDSDNAEIRYHLGYTLAKLDRISEAKKELSAAVASTQNFQEKVAAKDLLDSL